MVFKNSLHKLSSNEILEIFKLWTLHLPAITMNFAFELLIVILKGSDQVAHFTVYGTRLLVSSQLLFELYPEHLVLFTYLGEAVF